MSELKVADLVAVGPVDAEQGGRVTAIHRDRVEVELNDSPGLRYWYSLADVRVGTARPRPTMHAWRWIAAKEKTVEVRPVCKHLLLANTCPDCGKD